MRGKVSVGKRRMERKDRGGWVEVVGMCVFCTSAQEGNGREESKAEKHGPSINDVMEKNGKSKRRKKEEDQRHKKKEKKTKEKTKEVEVLRGEGMSGRRTKGRWKGNGIRSGP